jgi:hypothetical protein
MGHYTSVILHPLDEKYCPDEAVLQKIIGSFNVSRVQIASGSNPYIDDEDDEVDEVDEVEKDVFWLQNVSLEEVLENKKKHQPESTHLMFPHEGYLRGITESLTTSIPPELANAYVPWDTGMTLGKWSAWDYDTGDVVAKGKFRISKSANGYPLSLQDYLTAFNANEEVQNLLAFLEQETQCQWTMRIQFS